MIPLALVEYARDGQAHRAMLSWEDFALLLTDPRIHAGEKERLPGWVPAIMKGPDLTMRRCSENVEALSCIVLDLDKGEPLDRCIDLAAGLQAIAHTSWSHRPDYPKARLVLPLAEPAPAAKWPTVWGAAARWAASRSLTVDPQCKDPSRLYFLPAVPTGIPERRREFHAGETTGDRLSWRWLVTHYPAPEVPRYHAAVRHAAERRLPGQPEDESARVAFARGVLATRCREIAGTAEGGGRNTLVFRAAAACAQLAQHRGLMSLAFAEAEILAAAMAAQLSQSEAVRAIQSGFQRGRADGPWPF